MAFVNQVGGQDELVFDGDSLVVSRDGDLLDAVPELRPRGSEPRCSDRRCQFSAALSPARSGAPKTMRLRVAT